MSGAPKNLFLVTVSFLPAASSGPRVAHWDKHMENFGPLVQAGLVPLGGGLLPADKTSTSGDFASEGTGAVILLRAENIEWVRDVIQRDIFWTSGEVWDHKTLSITPMVLLPGSQLKIE